MLNLTLFESLASRWSLLPVCWSVRWPVGLSYFTKRYSSMFLSENFLFFTFSILSHSSLSLLYFFLVIGRQNTIIIFHFIFRKAFNNKTMIYTFYIHIFAYYLPCIFDSFWVFSIKHCWGYSFFFSSHDFCLAQILCEHLTSSLLAAGRVL